MWVLMLNHIRDAHVELTQEVACADNKEALERLVERETVELYEDEMEAPYGPGTWKKTFRRGGPLEWHNRPSSDSAFVEVGTREEAMEESGRRYDEAFANMMRVD